MPKRSRSGLGSMPARVVAPASGDGGRSSLIERAAGSSPIMISSWKSSSAGYRISSTTGERRWISSMNSTSLGSRLVRIAARSPGRSSTGPEVWRRLTPSSLAMMCASVVLPSPGGPNSSTWSSASLLPLAAAMKISSCARTLSWPTYSASVAGRSERSNCSSCGEAGRAEIMRSGSTLNRVPSGPDSARADRRDGLVEPEDEREAEHLDGIFPRAGAADVVILQVLSAQAQPGEVVIQPGAVDPCAVHGRGALADVLQLGLYPVRAQPAEQREPGGHRDEEHRGQVHSCGFHFEGACRVASGRLAETDEADFRRHVFVELVAEEGAPAGVLVVAGGVGPVADLTPLAEGARGAEEVAPILRDRRCGDQRRQEPEDRHRPSAILHRCPRLFF